MSSSYVVSVAVTDSELLAVARKHCAELAGYDGEFPFGPGAEVYKVGGKMFALIGLDGEPAAVSIKLPPEMGAELRAAFPSTVTAGYHLNKTHWNTILLTGEPAASELTELLDISYGLVRASLPRRVRDQLPEA
jgi:predicted DNA-binding protein (MmcQ/YjbR family)